jgi:ubiquinone/menaquinone biosynthesis C-methylase UbiE
MEFQMSLKTLGKEVCPPLLWRKLKALKRKVWQVYPKGHHPHSQDLEMYWDEDMAKLLETWGDGNVWNEIPMFLFGLEGKVLDIACGTGKTIEINQKFNSKLDIYGCDISDLLIRKAEARGIQKNRLFVCDASNMTEYANDFFKYGYSIGSLEHFTEAKIDDLFRENARVVTGASFHMMPTSRSGKDEGWMKTIQSFYNNSPEWWVTRIKKHYPRVLVFDSAWNDELSVGKWFVCLKA